MLEGLTIMTKTVIKNLSIKNIAFIFLSTGEFFTWHGKLFLFLGDVKNNNGVSYNAWNMTDGDPAIFDADDIVTPVKKIEIAIEH